MLRQIQVKAMICYAVFFLFPGCFSSQFYVPAAVCLSEKHTGEESWGKINLTTLDGSASMGT